MPFSRAKSLDRLAEEAADYDRVITPDPALSDALNARVRGPRLGRWADTPRGVVYGRFPERALRDRKELYIHLLKETDLGWKPLLHGLETVLDAWEQTGRLRAILEYPHYDTDRFRAIVEELENTGSIFRAMQRTAPDFEGSVAVLAPDQLTGLDRRVLPEEHATLDRFTDEPAQLPPFHRFESSGQLVQTLVDTVAARPDAVDEVAVVLDPGGPYQRLLTSALNARDIPFSRRAALGGDPSVNTFLEMLRHAGMNHRLRVGDVRPILTHLGETLPGRYDRHRIESLSRDSLDELKRLLDVFASSTFGEALETYRERTNAPGAGEALDELHRLLEQFALLGKPVTRGDLNILEFLLGAFEPILSSEETRDELLLVDPRSATAVDRSVVFHLGLDESWARDATRRPWRDAREERRRQIRAFQALIQSGTRSYFFVQERHRQRECTPCPYFQLHFGNDFRRFSDHDSRLVAPTPRSSSGDGFEVRPVKSEPRTLEVLSQSSLNAFVQSPRQYFFGRLIDTVDNRYLERGRLFHDFVEFYVSHGDFVHERGLSPFLEKMIERMRPFREPDEIALLRTEFRLGLEMILDVLGRKNVEVFEPKGYEPRRTDNVFAEHFDRPLRASTSEAAFRNETLAGKGTVDLIVNPDHLMDFKSGSAPSRRSLLREASVDRFTDDPDFQATHYLAHHRMHYPDRPLRFTFFHFLEARRDQMAGEADPADTLITLRYYPRSFAEQIPRRETYDALVEGVAESNPRRKTLEGIGHGTYRDFFAARDFPDVDERGEAAASEVADDFVALCRETFRAAAYVEKGARSTLKELCAFRNRHFFREDLDRYETFLRQQLEKLNECRRGSFPVRGEVEELDLDDLEHRDLILDDRP